MNTRPTHVDPDQSHPYGSQPGRSPALFLVFTVLYLAWLVFIAAMSYLHPAK